MARPGESLFCGQLSASSPSSLPFARHLLGEPAPLRAGDIAGVIFARNLATWAGRGQATWPMRRWAVAASLELTLEEE